MRFTKPYGQLDNAKVLVIGHDPNLLNSDEIAEYCFFADYYMEKYKENKPTMASELKKYNLARSLYLYINNLTNYKYKSTEFYITNLCNIELRRVSKDTIYIPIEEAKSGIKEIEKIVINSNIKKIFVQSLQVNYWLQKLGVYSSNDNFVELASPDKEYCDKGIYYPCYQVKGKSSPMSKIWGKEFIAFNNIKLYPIPHVKFMNPQNCIKFRFKIEEVKKLNK